MEAATRVMDARIGQVLVSVCMLMLWAEEHSKSSLAMAKLN